MTIVTERCFRYGSSLIEFDLDDADTKLINGKAYPAVTSIHIINKEPNDFRFELVTEGINRQNRIIPAGAEERFDIPVISRYYLGAYDWHFSRIGSTNVRPGSVGVPSLLTSGTQTTDASTFTSASIGPTADALILAAWFSVSETHAHQSVASGFTVDGWTKVIEEDDGFILVSLWRGTASSSPGSGTAALTMAGEDKGGWIIAELTGHNSAAPISESASTTVSSSDTMSISLGGVACDNRSYGICGNFDNGANNITAGANETELAEVSLDSGTNRLQTQYGTNNGADATVNWAGLGTSSASVGLAVEIATSVAVAVIPTGASFII